MRNLAHFALSRKKLISQYGHVASRCDKVSYSAKTNYEVASVLEQETDCDFSVHSLPEAQRFSNKSRLWLFLQAPEATEAEEILALGIRRFVVDNEQDLFALLAALEAHPAVKIDILLRMRLKEHTIHTGKYFVYGMYAEQANNLAAKLAGHPRIKGLGIHFHRKTQNLSEWSLMEELQGMLSDEALSAISIVNAGGGIPVRDHNFREGGTPSIFAELGELRSWLSQHAITLMLEPGRFLAGPCMKLHAAILSVYDGTIVVNASVYNAAMDTFIAHTRLEVEGEVSSREGEAYTIKGMTPDAMDIFRYRVFLKEPKKGDVLVFRNAGAYNFSTEFCMLPKPETVVVD
ncbi:TPA: decarboxylase [Candidatus Woesearchaeota archaeon]|nr:decarboxylase [Candidatus Woesearchaeota archaeon]